MQPPVANTKLRDSLDADPEVDAELRRLIDRPIIPRQTVARLGGTGIDALVGAAPRLGIKQHEDNVGRHHLTLRDTARYVVARNRPRR